MRIEHLREEMLTMNHCVDATCPTFVAVNSKRISVLFLCEIYLPECLKQMFDPELRFTGFAFKNPEPPPSRYHVTLPKAFRFLMWLDTSGVSSGSNLPPTNGSFSLFVLDYVIGLLITESELPLVDLIEYREKIKPGPALAG